MFLLLFTSPALKIHSSAQCRDNLLKLDGYEIEERGLVAMKGKGELLTYWVVGQDPAYKRTAPLEETLDSSEDFGNLLKQKSPSQGTKTAELSPCFPPSTRWAQPERHVTKQPSDFLHRIRHVRLNGPRAECYGH